LFASAGAERIESSTAVGDFDWARYSLVKGQEAAH
jgi:hypothetical protein